MSKSCLHISARPGLTLIEVVASLGLLSTLLVGILVAYHRHADMIRTSQETLVAIDGLDELMCRWASQGILIPYPARGELPGEKGFVWRTEPIDASYREPLGIDIVRLTAHREEPIVDNQPIAFVDLAVPYVQPDSKDTQ